MAKTDRKAILVGISGASSSGKTTLARLLRDVFPQTFVLHQDDFYRLESELPFKDGLRDWDCAEALDFDAMARALEHIRTEGTFPSFVNSIEDQNTIGICPVPPTSISNAQTRVQSWLSSLSTPFPSDIRICIVDGFLMYGPSPPLSEIMSKHLDIRFLLTVSRAHATARREARDGYVTLEEFWADPPGYVDRVVWPNYAESHAWLFEGGDVEGGRLRADVLREKDILAVPAVVGSGGGGGGERGEGEGIGERGKDNSGGDDGTGLDVDMRIMFDWAVDTLMQRLEKFTKESS